MTGTRRVRADAKRSTERILEAAETVLADEPNATLERIADAAGLARATVHRRFANRTALLAALTERLNDRFRQAIDDANSSDDDPRVILERLAHSVFALKAGNRYALALPGTPGAENLAAIDALLDRLRSAGVITAVDPAWCRGVCLALLDEVHRLPAGSDALQGEDEIVARAALFVRTLLGALGGNP